MQQGALPNFFVVGTGKAGTTSLYHYLRQHPQIYMSPIKEPCYFASEIRPGNLDAAHRRHIRRQSEKLAKPYGWLVSEWDDYVALFNSVKKETAIGEVSPVYLWSGTAAGNIAARMPEARIIMILRDPGERAFSHYLHQMAVGLIHSTFREHLKECFQNRDRTISAYYPFLEVGLYYEQVKRYLERFPENNVRIHWFEEVWRQPAHFLQDLFEFLNVDLTFSADTSRRSLERKAPRFPLMNYGMKRFDIAHRLSGWMPSPVQSAIRKLLFRPGRALVMAPQDRRFLVNYYREDIGKLASLLDRDLSTWLR